MYRLSKKVILAGALSAFTGALVTSAQDIRETAKVPFAFHTQGPVLAAGQVNVSQFSNGQTYRVTDSQGKSTYWTASTQVDANPAKPHLTFTCYGNDCVLSEIAMPGSTIASKASAASVEKQLHRNIGLASMVHVALR